MATVMIANRTDGGNLLSNLKCSCKYTHLTRYYVQSLEGIEQMGSRHSNGSHNQRYKTRKKGKPTQNNRSYVQIESTKSNRIKTKMDLK